MPIAKLTHGRDVRLAAGVSDEIHHSHHQTIQARRSARGTRRDRRGGDDGLGGQGFRAAERPDRDLPRGGIFHQHAPQGEAGNRRERRAGAASGRDRPADREHRLHRRREDLRPRPGVDHPHPHRRNRGHRPVSGATDMREPTMIRRLLCGAGALGASTFAATAAWAAETAEAVGDAAAEAAAVIPTEVAAPAAEAAAAVPNPGNNAWMMTATVLVLLMILPGLALFYGGLTRSKNMLSTMTQIVATAALAFVMWVLWGYSTAFGPEGNAFFSWGNAFLSQVTPDSTAATFSDEVISEYVFISFQATFSAITAALVLGGTVERIKFSAVMVFVAIWLTIVYYPIAHMVWASGGLIFGWGALDFAGGTVVHINAGVSALVAALILGKRKGYP